MKYYIRLPEPERIRELDSPFAFSAQSAQGIAEELRKALAEPDYIQRWRQSLDPDDAETGCSVANHGDDHAEVTARGQIGLVADHHLRSVVVAELT